ncbi:unnamed protein product [Plutella xylostella]|uniref:(diamondback moth) hypothetical protein n=1 Tax=Plutella xylostella TaxID=51655 RepID=A0A8S4ET87_PLUXY|nr:unnamed protein product [Plutella xylostella]
MHRAPRMRAPPLRCIDNLLQAARVQNDDPGETPSAVGHASALRYLSWEYRLSDSYNQNSSLAHSYHSHSPYSPVLHCPPNLSKLHRTLLASPNPPLRQAAVSADGKYQDRSRRCSGAQAVSLDSLIEVNQVLAAPAQGQGESRDSCDRVPSNGGATAAGIFVQRGRLVHTWRRTVDGELRAQGLSWTEARAVAEDRTAWRTLVKTLCTTRVP